MTDEPMLLPTGMPGLDTILGGGLSRPSLAVIIGTPGAGKTILASHMIFNAAREGLKTVVFTSFSEGIEQYVEHMRSLDFFDAALIGDSVQLFTLASLITDEDATPATAIIRIIRTTGAKVVLLDEFQGADALLPTDQAIRVLLATLATQIRFLDTTLLVTIAGELRDARFHAVKYSPDGGQIEITLWQDAAGVHITVADHGIGIQSAGLPHLFDRFHRGINIDDRRFPGIGLGLYICHGIVTEHDVSIVVDSQPDKGSSFHIMLPHTPIAQGYHVS